MDLFSQIPPLEPLTCRHLVQGLIRLLIQHKDYAPQLQVQSLPFKMTTLPLLMIPQATVRHAQTLAQQLQVLPEVYSPRQLALRLMRQQVKLLHQLHPLELTL